MPQVVEDDAAVVAVRDLSQARTYSRRPDVASHQPMAVEQVSGRTGEDELGSGRAGKELFPEEAQRARSHVDDANTGAGLRLANPHGPALEIDVSGPKPQALAFPKAGGGGEGNDPG